MNTAIKQLLKLTPQNERESTYRACWVRYPKRELPRISNLASKAVAMTEHLGQNRI